MRLHRFVARLLACLAIAAQAASAQSAVVKLNVNLRQGPSSGTTLLTTLYPGDELTLLRPDTVSSYIEVRTASGLSGWVYTPRVRVFPAPPAPATGPDSVYRGCSLTGNAQTSARRELNRQKNRIAAPTSADLDATVTLAAMLAPGDDRERWRADRAATIEGLVVDVKKGGQETVNCGDSEEQYRDTHIEIALQGPDPDKRERVVVEVTPRWRAFVKAQGEDWTTAALRTRLVGRWVRFTGWLFFDDEHDDESENTRPGRALNWRATAWEIHPVTRIEILPGPPL